MALFVKKQRYGASSAEISFLSQYIKVTQASASGDGLALPASTSGQLFRVYGGKVLVQALIGTVTTAIQNSDPVLSFNVKQLSNAGVAVGTAVAIASTVDISSLEVGGTVFVEGDGTAAVKANAGCVFIGAAGGQWIAPQSEIYASTTATKTGAIKWDLWYTPLDNGAFVLPAALTAGVLTAAI